MDNKQISNWTSLSIPTKIVQDHLTPNKSQNNSNGWLRRPQMDIKDRDMRIRKYIGSYNKGHLHKQQKVVQLPRTSKEIKSTFTCKYSSSDIPSEIIVKSDLRPKIDK